MTVTYTNKVASAKHFGLFWKLLFRWKGSIYKLIWPEMFVFILLYYLLRCMYHYTLDPNQRKIFEDIALYCQSFTDMIPLTFVLGFYVNIVMTRWWDQYQTIPWPDNLSVFVSTSIHGLDRKGRLMRRTIMRYINLSFVMTLSMMSPRVKKRFPTYVHLVEAGFMTKQEKAIFEDLDGMYTQPKYWMPMVWAGTITSRARKEGRIRDDFAVKTILDTINKFRAGCGGLLVYDSISVPLVYTQVVTLAVYTFFMGTLMGRQHLDPSKGYPKNIVDLYVPWFTILQFLFYMGWLKVAETLINPFGEDDDDFDINQMIDRNLQVSYLIVDGMHSEYPDLVQDKYWEEGIPYDLPYTIASEQFKTGPYMGSTASMEVPQDQQFFVKTVPEFEIEEESSQGGLTTPGRRKKSFLKLDEEMGKIIRLHSGTEKPVQKGGEESDEDFWVTPKSTRKNSSMQSLFKQLSQNPSNSRKKLSRQISTGTSYGSNKDMIHSSGMKDNESMLNTKSSKLGTKLSPDFPEKKESSIFRLSLGSLKEEEHASKSDEEVEECISFLPQKEKKKKGKEESS